MENTSIVKEIRSLSDRLVELKPFYVESAFGSIFSWKELENLLNYRPAMSANRFKPSNRISYEWPSSAWQSDVNTYPSKLIDEIIRNYHFHIADCSRVNEKINTICLELENILKLPTDAHIYVDLSLKENTGFGIHYDFSHNLIVQIDGQTEITVWDIKNNGDDTPSEIESEPLFVKILSPGDTVFIPSLYYHRANSLSRRMSISFPSWTKSSDSFDDRHWISLDNILSS
jgi:hypothetical protein